MKVEDALENVGHYVDDARSSEPFDLHDGSKITLVGWQCGFEPMFVAVKSYLPGCSIGEDEAVELATDLLIERDWFSDEPTDPSYILFHPKPN